VACDQCFFRLYTLPETPTLKPLELYACLALPAFRYTSVIFSGLALIVGGNGAISPEQWNLVNKGEDKPWIIETRSRALDWQHNLPKLN
jgi:hypothetical protein